MEYEVSIVTLEDKKEYMVIRDMMVKGKRYCLLSHIKDANDICVRRIDKVNGKETFVLLDNEEELNQVMMEYLQTKK